jgi:hypothetical protein
LEIRWYRGVERTPAEHRIAFALTFAIKPFRTYARLHSNRWKCIHTFLHHCAPIVLGEPSLRRLASLMRSNSPRFFRDASIPLAQAGVTFRGERPDANSWSFR